MEAAKAMPGKMERREKLMFLLKKKHMNVVMLMEIRASSTKGTLSVLFLFLLFIFILFVL
ncbi:hypothetical protein RND71_024009 [Anisodus tanguticus]|uniref:Transmembrane protein n=1 Tax=Anisodus tanguticus TaxID=243964 RepID=A0AAE1RW83_9SOLA|nr:hypothetical protein RND71_024009 [Anisodus tanguticus]